MRFLFIATLAGIFTLTSVTEADARRRSSTTEDLVFIAPTGLPGPDGGELSLCMLTSQESVFFVNIWLSAKTYAVAENNCSATSYMAVEPAIFAEMQAAGVIPSSLPDTPRLSTAQMLNGFWGLGAGAALLGFFALGAVRKSRRKKERLPAMGDASPEAVRILDVLCHAANADGEIDAGEVEVIANIAQKLTGTSFGEEEITRMIELSEQKMEPSDFKALTKGLSPENRRLAMRGALLVSTSDGKLAESEKAFIGGLSAALEIGVDEINDFLNGLAGGGQQAPA